MRTQDWRKPNKEKPKPDDRLKRELGRGGDRTIESFYKLKTGEDRLSEEEIIAESGSLQSLEQMLKQNKKTK